MARRILDHEFNDLGVEHEQYFQGFGVSFTRFDYCATGAGTDLKEAIDDCLESIAQDGFETTDLERQICQELGVPNLEALANVGMVEDADCEVWHYIGIRWREVPNLDSMEQGELIKINDDSTMPEKLREYAALKWRAMQSRTDGQTQRALNWERAADGCYKLLPENLKW